MLLFCPKSVFQVLADHHHLPNHSGRNPRFFSFPCTPCPICRLCLQIQTLSVHFTSNFQVSASKLCMFPLHPFSSHSEELVPLDIKWSNMHRAGREVWVKHSLKRRLQRRSAAPASHASRTDATTEAGFPQICFTHVATGLSRISAGNWLPIH